MEILSIRDFSFQYPKSPSQVEEMKALDHINFSMEEGAFTLVCGLSGSGKTTLLKQIKSSMADHGKRSGQILFRDNDIGDLCQREEASKIGFVQQNPQNQVVTDKVWHELAFGLESLGLDQDSIRLRVGEIASFFNMDSWFYKSVHELSGGQMQMMNLASILVMQPELLILDEPTSQLDPIAAREFFEVLKRVNQELGITIILSEHRLGDIYPLVDQVVFLDKGRQVYVGNPRSFASFLNGNNHPIMDSLPAPLQIYARLEGGHEAPLTVGEGIKWLSKINLKKVVEVTPKDVPQEENEIFYLKEVSFRYKKEGKEVLHSLSLKIMEERISCLLGGNGAGKTTTLKMLAGLIKPSRGLILDRKKKRKLNQGLLDNIIFIPQDPKSIFSKKTVEEELKELAPKNEEETEANLEYWTGRFMLKGLYNSHPYDISGGEQQRLAIAKCLMADKEIILMDEPTKGMDGAFKEKFLQILVDLKKEGKTIVLVSHDIEFCAKAGDYSYLLFNGQVIGQGRAKEFYAENYFYTTECNKMFRPWRRDLITIEEGVNFVESQYEA